MASARKLMRISDGRTPMCSAMPVATPPANPRSGRRYSCGGAAGTVPGDDTRGGVNGAVVFIVTNHCRCRHRCASGGARSPGLRVPAYRQVRIRRTRAGSLRSAAC